MSIEATIIAASLNDKELKESIAALVDTVDDGMDKVSAKFDVKLKAIEEKFKTAGTNIGTAFKDSFNAAFGGSFDQLAAAMEKMSKANTKAASASNASNASSTVSGAKNRNITYPEDSIGELRQQIKELQRKLNYEQKSSDELKKQVDLLHQAKAELKTQTTTRTFPSILAMPETSVTQIAEKMKALRNVQVQNAGDAKNLQSEYQRLSQKQKELLGNTNLLTNGNNALARSFGYIRNRIVYALTLGAASSFVKQLYEIRGQYELLERSLGVLVNSFEKGSQIFQELNEMAVKSPFTLVELGTAAKQLTAYNFAADEVVDTTRRLADISAALGVPMERLTYNLGQIRAQTVLTARDARDFANAGLPIVASLAQHFTELEGKVVTTGDVYDRMSKKMVSYSDVMSVLNKMTDEGGKFFDFQAKQAQTLRVQMANLTLAWNNMLNEVGKSNQGFLQLPLRGLKALLENWQTLNRVLTSIAITIGSAKAAQLLFNLSLSKANIETLRNIALTQNATAADYESAIAKMNLTKAQAQWLISTNRNNVTLRAAIVNMRVLTTAEAEAAATTNILRSQWVAFGATAKIVGAGIRLAAVSIKTALSSLLLNPAMWIFVATTAITDLVLQAKAAREAMHELNQEISDNAKEASQSMLDYLNNQGNQSTRRLAQQNKLTVEEGAKAWESVSEQIKQSALSSNMLMRELLAIPDINKRVAKSFEYAEKIQQAQAALQNLRDDTIKMSTDSGWWGMFGEGLTSDLKDYADYIEKYTEIAKSSGLGGEKAANFIFNVGAVKNAREEFEKELDVTAESINNFIAAHNITDPIQINEILERVRAQIKTKNPQIRGELAHIFDVSLDKKMAVLTNGAVDQNATLWKMFMERLKSQSSAAFQDINDEWVQSNQQLTPKQRKAIDDNLEYFKQSVPYAYEALAKMVDDANQNLRINIGITFGKGALTNFQKEVNKRISGSAGVLDFGSDALLPTQNEKLQEWVNRQQQGIKGLHEANKLYAKDSSQWAQDQIKANDKEIQQRENLLDLFNQSYSADKKTTARHRKDVDLVAEALKQEISLINEMRSNYDKLRKAGMTNMDAITLASEGYEDTIKRINKVLQKFRIPEFKASDFAGTNVKQLLDSLTKQRDEIIASGKVKTSSLKDLDVIIKKLTIDAKTYDLDKITKGLNSELDRLKEEYELAVSLDADPELGSMLASYMGVNLDELPRNAEQAAKKAQEYIDKILAENKSSEKIDISSLLDKNAFDKWIKESGHTLEDGLVKVVSAFRSYLIKLITDETKSIAQDWDKLLEKYAEYETKISKIQNDAVKERVTFAQKFGKGDLALNLQTQILAATDPQEKQRLIEQLKQLVTDIAGDDKTKVNLVTAIDNSELQSSARATFEAFKKGSDYVRFFTAIDTFTQKDALSVKNKIKEGIIKAFKDGGLTINEFQKELKRLEEQFDELTKTSSNWQSYLEGGFDALIKKAKKTGSEIQVIGESIKATGKVDEKDKNFLDSLGEMFSDNDGNKMNFSSLMETFGDNVEGLGNSVSEAGQSMQGAAGDFQGAIMIVDMIIKGVHQTIMGIDSVIGELNSMRGEHNKLGNSYWENFKKFDKYAFGGWEKLKNGDIAGAMADTVNSLIVVYRQLSGFDRHEEKIDRKIRDSELAVKRLQNAYKELEYSVEKAYGTAVTGAKKLTKVNKELELAELKRQLGLEESRNKKKRDQDKINDLRAQIIDLEHEIQDIGEDIVNDLLGISDVGSAIEDIIGDFIDALRGGEDAMSTFNENIDDMIANMVKKLLATKVIGPWFEKQWEEIQKTIEERGGDLPQQMLELQQKINSIPNPEGLDAHAIFAALGSVGWSGADLWREIGYKWGHGLINDKTIKNLKDLGYTDELIEQMKSRGGISGEIQMKILQMLLNKAINNLKGDYENLEDALSEQTSVTIEDIRRYAEMLRSGQPILSENMKEIENFLKELGLMNEAKDKDLSALQQGIASISEQTAGALEAYMNQTLQQVYYHSTLLEEIRNKVVAFDTDVQLGTLSQMLLQLQNNYIVMQSMQSMMQNWTVPSGSGIRVELMS